MAREVHEDAMHRISLEVVEGAAEDVREHPAAYIARIKASVTAELHRLGFPNPRLWHSILESEDRLSPAALLAQVWRDAGELERALDDGNPVWAADIGIRLGRAIELYNSRRAFLTRVEVGGKSLRASREGRKARTDDSFKVKHGMKAQAVADDLHRANPDRPFTWICTRIAERYEVSPETVRKSIFNPKKTG